MIDLLEYITPDSICFPEKEAYEDVLNEVMRHCFRSVPNPNAFEEALKIILSRSHSRTAQDINLGHGFALAHARLPNLDRIHLALGVLPGSRKFLKGEPVHTLLGLAIPESQARTYLSLLARIGRMLNRDDATACFEQAGRHLAEAKQEDASRIIMEYVREFEAR